MTNEERNKIKAEVQEIETSVRRIESMYIGVMLPGLVYETVQKLDHVARRLERMAESNR